MDFRNKVMVDTFVEWIAANSNTNGNIFSATNGVQNQALSLTTYSSGGQNNNSSDNGNHSGKTLSVRCIVESIPSSQFWDMTQDSVPNGQVELKKTVDVPTHTVMYNLVDEVLQRFGYSKEIASTARGSILIENWRPLRLEKIPSSSQKTVNDVFGQMSSIVTLKIQVLKPAAFTKVKDRLLQLLIQQNRDLILNSGCPLDPITLKRIFDGNDFQTSALSEDMAAKFEQWLISQSHQDIRRMPPFPSPLTQFPYHLASPSAAFSYDKALPTSTDDKVHPALQTIQSQYPTQKTRMRTSFDPELELPKLHKWFAENQHPNRRQILHYVNELNNLESRKGRKPLDVNNVVYWFKNARAAQKRAEMKNVNSGHLNSLNGYRSNSHSPCETAANSKESLGSAHSCDEDDMDDDDNRSDGDEREDSSDAQPPNSPVAPLSLTTTHRNNDDSRNSSPIPQMKQEPPDKEAGIEGTVVNSKSPAEEKKAESGPSPVAEPPESETEDEMTDDEGSDADSTHKSSCGILDPDYSKPNSPSFFPNSSHLSLISRSASNSAPFPLVPNSMFGNPYSFFSVNPYLPNMALTASGTSACSRTPLHHAVAPSAGNHSPHSSGGGAGNVAVANDERRNKRNRTFIDPVSEVPRLEKWYKENSHPTQTQILTYTENLNTLPYRSKFPKLEHKNVQFWFKNRRAKEKRLKTSLYDGISINNNLTTQEHYQLAVAMSAENYRNHD